MTQESSKPAHDCALCWWDQHQIRSHWPREACGVGRGGDQIRVGRADPWVDWPREEGGVSLLDWILTTATRIGLMQGP